MVDADALGKAVRSARLERGLRQADLAERLGVSRMTVSRLERDGPVSMDTAVRALAECGAALAVVPKFARIEVTPNDQWPRSEHRGPRRNRPRLNR